MNLEMFIRALDGELSWPPDPEGELRAASQLLSRLVEDDGWLAAAHREPGLDQYRQHIVHVHPQGRYSVVSLVWTPGQSTPIHDHRCWCVVGVISGTENEVRYRLEGTEEARERLVPFENTMNNAGSVSALDASTTNIHSVANAADVTTISIHVYGGNIRRLGSSINRIYSQPVMELSGSAAD